MQVGPEGVRPKKVGCGEQKTEGASAKSLLMLSVERAHANTRKIKRIHHQHGWIPPPIAEHHLSDPQSCTMLSSNRCQKQNNCRLQTHRPTPGRDRTSHHGTRGSMAYFPRGIANRHRKTSSNLKTEHLLTRRCVSLPPPPTPPPTPARPHPAGASRPGGCLQRRPRSWP